MKLKVIMLGLTITALAVICYVYTSKEPPLKSTYLIPADLNTFLVALNTNAVLYKDPLFKDWLTKRCKELNFEISSINFSKPEPKSRTYRQYINWLGIISPTYLESIKENTLDYSYKFRPKFSPQLLAANYEAECRKLIEINNIYGSDKKLSSSLNHAPIAYLTLIYPKFDIDDLLENPETYINNTMFKVKVRP